MTRTLTESGRLVDLAAAPFEIPPGMIVVEDIAAHLAKINRWAGATSLPLSVAQHSVMVADVAARMDRGNNPAAPLYALLHDGHEYLLGDWPRPAVEQLHPMARQELDNLKRDVQVAIHLALGMRAMPDLQVAAIVEHADAVALTTEARDLTRSHDHPGLFDALPPPAAQAVRPWPWIQAQEAFLLKFHEYALLAGIDPDRARIATAR